MKRLVLVLAAIAGPACAEDRLEQAWLDKDVALSKKIVAALPGADASAADFLKALDAEAETHDAGFGAKRVEVTLNGGYATVWIRFVRVGDRIGPGVIQCSGDPNAWPLLRDQLLPLWKPASPLELAHAFHVQFGTHKNLEAADAERVKALGAPSGATPPGDLDEAIRILTSPLQELTYGLSYAYGGGPPPGRPETEQILRHDKALTVLADVLRGPNPEGRVYAAEALTRLEKQGATLPEDVKKALALVRDSELPVMVCYGCLTGREPAKKQFEAMLAEAARK